jgi:iron(III) transport system permease protein
VKLFKEQPQARMVLWARGTLLEISKGRARIDAELLTDLVVPSDALAGYDFEPGSQIHFRPEKSLSLLNYRGLVSEVPDFLGGLLRWITFRKPDFPKRLGLLFNTFIVSILASLAATVIGVLYALLTVKFPTPGRTIFSWVYVGPLLIPPYISAISWTLLLGEEGSLSKVLKKAFDLEQAPFTVYGIPGSVLVLSLAFFPIVTLLTQVGLRTINRELEEAALLARGRWHALFHVTLPLCAPYVFSGSVFVFIFALSSSGAPALLRLQLYSSMVMVNFQTDLSGGEAMATGTPLVLFAMGAVVLQGIVMGRKRFTSTTMNPLTYRLGTMGKTIAAGLILFLLLLAAGVPLVILVQRAGSLDSFRTALVEMRSDIYHSVTTAFGAATLAMVVGGSVGYLAARLPRGGALEILTIIPYAAPASVVGAGLLGLWDKPGLAGAAYTSGAIIALAGFTRFIPFAVKPAASAVRAIDPDLENAGNIHGVSWFRRMTGVVIPLAGRGFVASWILVFVLSLGELDATILVAPAGVTTVPIRIFNAIHFGRVEVVSALCLILVFIAALPLMIYSLVTSKKLEVI